MLKPLVFSGNLNNESLWDCVSIPALQHSNPPGPPPAVMNIHHLELYYYVARHGGITEAVRNIPYGIQQPAVSGQVAQLEEYLGVTLFQRRPFTLTPAGEKLYQFILPFFSSLDLVASELQGGKARQIRIGASTIV